MAFGYVQFAISIITGIILVPIYLKYISVYLYGAWLTTGSVVILLTIFDPGVAGLLMQNTASEYGKNNLKKMGELITLGFLISVAIALVMIITGTFIGPHITKWLNIKDDTGIIQRAFSIAVLTSALMLVYYSINAINYAFQSSLAIGIIFIGSIIFKIIFVILFLNAGLGLLSIPYSELAAAFLMIILNIFLLVRNMQKNHVLLRIRFDGLKNFLGLFIYTFVARISKITTKNIDNFFISYYLSPVSVVTYNLTSRAPTASENIIKLPVAAFRPALANVTGSGDLSTARAVIARLLRIVLWSIGIITTGFIVFNEDFVRLWVGSQHYAGTLVNLLICFAFSLFVWTNVTSMLLFSVGGIKKSSLADTISSILLIPLIFIGIRFFGLAGLVFAHIITMLIAGAYYLPANIIKRLSFSKIEVFSLLKELIVVVVISVVIIIGFKNICAHGWLTLIIYACLLTLMYFILLVITSKNMREELRNFWLLISNCTKKYNKEVGT